MLAVGNGCAEANSVLERGRSSDEDLLKTIRHDLAAVYTDVLHCPIPDGVAAILGRIEAAFSVRTTCTGLTRVDRASAI